jgi:hypothetical protein
MKTNKAQQLIRVIKFLYDVNIDVVESIFVKQLSIEEAKQLCDKAKSIRQEYNNNERAWIYFILDLTDKQLNVLAEYVFTK